MYIDKLLELEPGVAAVTANANSTNILDLGSDRDVGPGARLWLVLQILAIDAGTGDETYSIAINTDGNNPPSTGTALVTLGIPRTTPAHTRFSIGLPSINGRYLCTRAALGGTTPSITYQAWITSEEPSHTFAYPNAI